MKLKYFLPILFVAGCGPKPAPVTEGGNPSAPPVSATSKFDVNKIKGEVRQTYLGGIQQGGVMPNNTNIGVYYVDFEIRNLSDVPLKAVKYKLHIEIPGTDFKSTAESTTDQARTVAMAMEGVLMPGQMTSSISHPITGVAREHLGRPMTARLEIVDALPMPINENYQDSDQFAWLLQQGDQAKIAAAIDADKEILGIRNKMTLLPIHLAILLQPKVEIVKLLESKGADIHEYTEGGENALHFAAFSTPEMIAYVSSQGVPSHRDPSEYSNPLHYAVLADNPKAIVPLVKAGVPMNEMQAKGFTPLMTAVRYARIEVFREFIKAGSKLDDKYDDGQGVLIMSIYSGSLAMVEEVVKARKGSIKEVSATGGTPLHYAVRYGFLEIVKWLISKGADPNAKDKNMETPIDLANQTPYPWLQEELLKAMGQ